MAQRSDLIEKILRTPGQSDLLRAAFLDIVKYSLRVPGVQAGVIQRFTDCLHGALLEVYAHYKTYEHDNHFNFRTDIIKLPTGDGAALVFPFQGFHDIYLFFAQRLLARVHALNAAEPCAEFEEKGWCNCHFNFKVRAGLSADLGIIYKDITGDYNVAGDVMNMAARVTALADGGHILLTHDAFKDISAQFKDDRAFTTHFDKHPGMLVKHGVKLDVHQYRDEGEPYLNNNPPSCISARQSVRLLDRPDIWDAVVEKVMNAQERIRVVFLASRPPVPERVLEAIAGRLADEVEYEIVLVHRPGDEMELFRENHERLLTMLRQTGAQGRYFIYRLETDNPICFDTIIIDERDVGIGFTRTTSSLEIHSAVSFENKPEIVKKFIDWFEHYIKRKAQGYH